MLKASFIEIIDQIKAANPVFTEGVFVTSNNEKELFDDSRGTYFAIKLIENNNGITYTTAESSIFAGKGYDVSASARLIAVFKCADVETVLGKLTYQLGKISGVTVASSSTNSQIIYRAETGEDLPAEFDIIRIDFSLTRPVSLSCYAGSEICFDGSNCC